MTSLDRRSFLKSTTAGLASVAAARGETHPANDDPLGVRAEFPITETQAYLNTASSGPFPRAVRTAALAFAEEKTLRPTPGRRQETRASARAKFAKLFDAKEEEVAFLYSTSDGENIVARGLDLQAGDNVVIDELHFITSFVLFRQLEEERGIELRVVPQKNGRAPVEEFEARVDRRTRLISVAWVSNRNGYRHDVRALADLAHSHGALLYADAIQAFGTFPLKNSKSRVWISRPVIRTSGFTPAMESRLFLFAQSISTVSAPIATVMPRWRSHSPTTKTAYRKRLESSSMRTRLTVPCINWTPPFRFSRMLGSRGSKLMA